MNHYFVTNEDLAKSLDSNAVKGIKTWYDCCPVCDEDPMEVDGWLVATNQDLTDVDGVYAHCNCRPA